MASRRRASSGEEARSTEPLAAYGKKRDFTRTPEPGPAVPEKPAKRRPRIEKDANTLALEKRLSDALGLAVGIEQRGQGGELKIRYRNLEQLDEVVHRLERG